MRPAPTLRLAEVIGALSHALDLTEGQPPGHSLRSCWIGMHIGRALGLEAQVLTDLFYALLLKDAGCSSNAARMCELFGADDREMKRAVKTVNLQNTLQHGMFILKHTKPGSKLVARLRRFAQIARNSETLAQELITARCERGADIARQLGFGDAVAEGIQGLDEHWNGRGRPLGLEGDAIPMISRIALLAQVVEVFHAESGSRRALREVRRRSGRWFDPELVDVLRDIAQDGEMWEGLTARDIELRVMSLEPRALSVEVDDDRLDAIAVGFGQVIDAKSPFTSGHSVRVASFAAGMSDAFGLPDDRRRLIRRAGMLHDIGKLGISNTILDKPGKLSDAEWAEIKRHPIYTHDILSRIGPFQELAALSAAHHERLDGRGYPNALEGEEIRIETRIVSVADIYDALTADRPYRASMRPTKALGILHEMSGTALDAKCVRVLETLVRDRERGTEEPDPAGAPLVACDLQAGAIRR